MISRVRNSVFLRFFWGLLGLYFLNISVDTTDFNPDYLPEDLSINDQESIIEIVVEKVLGYEDAIREYDDNDPEDHNSYKNAKLDLKTHCLNESSFFGLFSGSTDKVQTVVLEHLSDGFHNNLTPPPEV